MPKDTFFNLPEEKRRAIIDLALDEFASNRYHRASLSRIVEKAGIAKGSMYQYFEDKFDLYAYILWLVGEAKLRLIGEFTAKLGPEPDIIEMFMAATEASVGLAKVDPRFLAVGENLLSETDKNLLERVRSKMNPEGAAVAGPWLAGAIAKGQIDPGVKPETAYYIISAVTWQIGRDLGAGNLSLNGALAFVREVFNILEYGLRPRKAREAGTPARETGSQPKEAGTQ